MKNNPSYKTKTLLFRRWPRGIYFLLMFMVVTLLGACSSKQASNSGSSKIASDPAPHLDPLSVPLYPANKKAQARDFSARRVNGKSFSLSAQRGKVVVLNIWATWCAPCREETPELVKLYNEYREKGLVVLGVSIDEQGKSVVEPFIKKYNVTYPIIIDDGSVMDKYGPTMGIPTTYIIDKDGDIKYFAVGPLTRKELLPRLKKLLNEKA